MRRHDEHWVLLVQGPPARGKELMRERTYEIRLTGQVSLDDLQEEVGEVVIAEQELWTVLSGKFEDQAELHGFLNRLREFGLEIVEVRRVPGGEEPK
jgi:hypothetical protein